MSLAVLIKPGRVLRAPLAEEDDEEEDALALMAAPRAIAFESRPCRNSITCARWLSKMEIMTTLTRYVRAS